MTALSAVLAVFVSPHGFGHAARACAVMEALSELNPKVRFEVFTTVSEAFFRESLGDGCFGYHRLRTDVGLVQTAPFAADLRATARALAGFFPFSPALIDSLSKRLGRLGCVGVLCDISPLGIAVARAAGVPSVLVENFTWDWIYEDFAGRCPDMAPFVSGLGRVFADAEIRIQAEPVCRPTEAALTVGPVGRKIRTRGSEVRSRLGVPAGRPMVLVSQGGIVGRPADLNRLSQRSDLFFVLTNAGVRGRLAANVLALDALSGVYHPDLVGAADALIGKAGYSTIAEACRAGVPFGFRTWRDFREAAVLEEFILTRMGGIALDPEGFDEGGWIDRIDALLDQPRRPVDALGAEEIAAFLEMKLAFSGAEKDRLNTGRGRTSNSERCTSNVE